jgi:hypothetical protein
MLEILKLILSRISKRKKKNVYGKNYMWGNERSRTYDFTNCGEENSTLFAYSVQGKEVIVSNGSVVQRRLR